MAALNRKPTSNIPLSIEKKPKSSIDPAVGRDKPIVWTFHQMVLDRSRNWNWLQLADEDVFCDVFTKLGQLEKSTFNELNSQPGHHYITVENFSRKARKELDSLNLSDIPSLFSLRLQGSVRVFCTTQTNVFSLLWYDPNHEVCPSRRY